MKNDGFQSNQSELNLNAGTKHASKRAYNFNISELHAPIKREKTTTNTEFVGIERVKPELSGKAGSGRVGKIDDCIKCGQTFQIAAYNQVKCKACSDADKNSYEKTQLKTK